MKNINLRFTKVTAAGNDFILFDTLNNVIPLLSGEKIQELCTRGLNVGADGVLILVPSTQADFKVHYFNADGSSGMLCANGARSSVIYAKKYFDIKGDEIVIECCGQNFKNEILGNDKVRFHLAGKPTTKETLILLNGIETTIFLADTGAPHVVFSFAQFKEIFPELINADFHSFNMNRYGEIIRNHTSFYPEGINVNVIEIIDGEIFIRSYERGVENETLACGTGIIAAAMFLVEKENYSSPIEVISRSGKKFVVELNYEKKEFSEVKLIGEAKIVYHGEIISDDYSLR